MAVIVRAIMEEVGMVGSTERNSEVARCKREARKGNVI
jgi:hypothetical protein